MLVYYIFREFLGSIYRGREFKKSDVYKGFDLYRKTSKKTKKNILLVFFELEKFCMYWRCFPDTYFRFGMFFKNYTDKKLMKTYLPQAVYGRLILSENPKYEVLLNDKILFNRVMNYYSLPTTKHFFTWYNKNFYNENSIIPDDEVDYIIDKIKDDRVFVKSFTGGAASGISIFKKANDGFYYDEKQNKLSSSTIRGKYNDTNYLFEKQIIQEPVLAKFNPDTVNTIRVLTKDYDIVSASVRVGRKGAFVDNAAKGGIVLSLDINTGVISEYGLREYDIEKYYFHPDSGLVFKGVRVTQWEEVKKLILTTLKYLPYYKSIGFDIATTNEGPVIIEINTGTGVYASQMGKDVGIADKFL